MTLIISGLHILLVVIQSLTTDANTEGQLVYDFTDCSGSNCNVNIGKIERERRFRELFKGLIAKKMINFELRSPESAMSSVSTSPAAVTVVSRDAKDILFTIPEDNNILVLTLAISMDDLYSKQSAILKDLELGVRRKAVHCYVTEMSRISSTDSSVDVFCSVYLPASGLSSPRLTYVSGHELEQLLASGSMRSFLVKFNVTGFYRKNFKREASPAAKMAEKLWFPAALAAGASFTVALLALLILMCCRKFVCKESPGSPEKLLVLKRSPQRPSFIISPVQSQDKVTHPALSPIDTSGPQLVQPQLGLLFPLETPSNHAGRRWSQESQRSRTLFQSRRGSHASLSIDLSPAGNSDNVQDLLHESPTEEILLRKSRLLCYWDLKKAIDQEKDLYEEFWSIPPNIVSRKGTQMKHGLKNRYPDIVPNSRTMVRLRVDADDPSSSSYVNANFIRGHNGVPNTYIATQGPLPLTVTDFWKMVWQCNCSVIVMITKLKEKNEDKCTQYWAGASTKQQVTYGSITVTFDSEMSRDGYVINILYISNSKAMDETRKITHFWFTAWPDHKVPQSCHQILSLVKEVRALQHSQFGPVIVHCSAGRGRTGCFIGISVGISQIEEENSVDILKIVSLMRIDRGGMVEKDSQYIFIYRCLFEFWRDWRAAISSRDFGEIEEAADEKDSVREFNPKFGGFFFE